MLLLLVLTILGITMMRMNHMQERMAGNTRDLSLALQGAEAGLRYAEAKMTALPSPAPISLGSFPCGTADNPCQNNVLPVAVYDPVQFDWNANAQPAGAVVGLSVPPQFVVEYLTHVSDTINEGDTDDLGAGRDFYQITSRSTGASGQTNTVLQSTYQRRF
jgi:type IV pilus assembly protein PilX